MLATRALLQLRLSPYQHRSGWPWPRHFDQLAVLRAWQKLGWLCFERQVQVQLQLKLQVLVQGQVAAGQQVALQVLLTWV
jgi:hypothetical protein